MGSKRKSLSIETKVAIINEVDKGRKKKDVAQEFGIAPTTLSTVLSLREKILKSFSGENLKEDHKRFRAPTFTDVEQALLVWFKDVRSRNLPISGAVLEDKANSLALLLGHEEFKASAGWISRFKERHNIVCHQLSGEAAAVSEDTIDAWLTQVNPILNEYSEHDIYNMDETGLFYKMMPEMTLAFKHEKCHGGKKSKERLTVVLACNMDGSDKRKMVVIGKSKKPRCFKGVSFLPVEYVANAKAWMTSALFEVWLRDLDSDMKRQKRKILLVLDNCTAHKVAIELEAVRLLYLPPNTTSRLQPLDQGIIRSLKAHYRKRIVSSIVFNMDAGRETVITVKSAIDFIFAAWNAVDATVIKNCFRKAKITRADVNFPEDEMVTENADCPSSLWEQLGVSSCSFEDFIGVDEEVETAPELSDAEILQQVRVQSEENNSSDADEETAGTPEQLTSVQSLDMIYKLKHYFSGIVGVKEEDMFECLKGLQKCESVLLSNTVFQKQTKISDFFK